MQRAPNRPLATLAWSQLVWFVIAASIWSGILFTLSVDPDYTAGELLDHLLAWRDTGVLYPHVGAAPPLRVLNYPPLVLLMARGLAELGVPAITSGRLVNALGLAALVSGVTWWARVRGARGAALAGTVGLLGASLSVLYGAGQFHIELWASAGTVWGFALLQRASSWRGAALGALALALGCFAKQTQVVPSLVALAWMWTHRRALAWAAVAMFVAVGLAGAGAISVAFGAEAWRHTVMYTVGSYSALNLAEQLLTNALPWGILIVFTAYAARENPSRWSDPALWYWCGALVWCLSSARLGSSYPYFLDLQLATAVCAGPRIFGAAGVASRAWRWLLAIQIVGADIAAGATLAVHLTRAERTDAELPALCARLVGAQPILAEEAGIVRACGRPALLDPFIMASLAAQGRWDAAPLERAIRAGEYRRVVLPFDPRLPARGAHAQRWTAAELAAFRDAPFVDVAPTGRWIARW